MTPRGRGARGWRAWPASWCPADSGSAASRARSPRPAMPGRTKMPYLGLCLGMQVMVVEFARQRAGPAGGQLPRVQCPHAGPGDRLPAGPAGPDQEGRHHAAGALCLRGGPGQPSRRGLWRAGDLRAAPAPLRVQQRLRRAPWRPPGWPRPASRPTTGWWRSARWPTTRGWWAASSTPSSGRAPTGRIRSSAISSARRWPPRHGHRRPPSCRRPAPTTSGPGRAATGSGLDRAARRPAPRREAAPGSVPICSRAASSPAADQLRRVVGRHGIVHPGLWLDEHADRLGLGLGDLVLHHLQRPQQGLHDAGQPPGIVPCPRPSRPCACRPTPARPRTRSSGSAVTFTATMMLAPCCASTLQGTGLTAPPST